MSKGVIKRGAHIEAFGHEQNSFSTLVTQMFQCET